MMASPNSESRILEVAKTLFTQRGFSNVSVRDICRDSHVTPPTIYYYFKGKEALFEAVVHETITMTEFIARLDQECRKEKSSTSRIKVFVGTYLSSFPKDIINVGLYVRRSTMLDSVSTKALVAELDRIQSILTDIIQRGIKSGEFRNIDPNMAAECLLGMVNRFVFQRIHFKRPYRPSEVASSLSHFFLRAVEASLVPYRRE